MNWRKSMIGLGISLPIVGLLAFGMTRDPRAIPSPLPGRDAPEFALQVLDSQDTARLADHRGEVVVLNFWASWCLECRIEHNDLNMAASFYGPKGVSFYGVLYNDTPANGRAWIREMGGQTYPALIDTGSRTAIDYGLYGVPETFIIGRDGKVVHKQIGPLSMQKLAAILDPLLAEPTTDPAAAAGEEEDR
jgi:cytochrome c biogenesis protein CcmG, thiol:disulfide interchange protein DsbE